MSDEVKSLEQKNVNETCQKIRVIEKESFEQYEVGKKNYYNTQIDFYDQRKFQELFSESKEYLDTFVNPIIQSPFIGKIKYLTAGGVEGTAYIGKKAYAKETVKIHDWRSAEGTAFRSKKRYSEGMNVLLNRTLDIRDSIVNSYFDFIDYETEFDLSDTVEYKELLEFNKRKKDILTTLDHIQNQVIDLPLKNNVVLHGVPGSGKTAIGGYRLSNIAFRLNENQDKNFKLLYITTTQSLKAYTVEHFNAIDRNHITFATMEDVLEFSTIGEQKSQDKKSVLIGDYSIKGELVKTLAESTGDTVEVKLPDGSVRWHSKKDVKLYMNIWNEHAKRVFGRNNLIQKVREFLQHPKSKNLFMLMNDPRNENIVLRVGKVALRDKLTQAKLIHTFKKVLTSVQLLSKEDFQYLINFSKLYYLLKVKKSLKSDDAVKAIFLDEAQDFTVLEILFLRHKYPNATFTLCGDVNQSSGKGYVQENWNSVIEVLDAKFMAFNNCYRSSKKIVDTLNSRMLNSEYGTATAVSTKDGIVAEVKNFDAFIKKNISLLDEDTCFIYLKPETYLKLENIAKNNEVKLLHANDVKGLEFENVVLFDIDEVKKLSLHKKFIYMLISRALVNLYYVH